MNEARIKLAEAMFPDKKIYHMAPGRDDGGLIGYYLANGNFRTFDPFTDANDDFAVLEWARDTYIDIMGSAKEWQDFEAALLTCRSQGCDTHWTTYRIGDYARAACKALGITIFNGGQKNG